MEALLIVNSVIVVGLTIAGIWVAFKFEDHQKAHSKGGNFSQNTRDWVQEVLDKRFRQHDCDHTEVTFHDRPNCHRVGVLELTIRCTSCNKEWPTFNGPTIQEESKDVQRALLMDPKVSWVFKEHVDRDIFSKKEIQAFVTLGILQQLEKPIGEILNG